MAVSILDPLGMAESFDQELDKRAGPMNRYWDYYRGDARVLYVTAKFRQHFARLLNEVSDNWCEVIIDSSIERLRLTGFRFGKDEVADTEAWEIWQASYLDADQVLAHEQASVTSLCNLFVEPNPDDADHPRISPLSPLESATINAGEDRRRRVAGYRRWIDEFGIPNARIYLADRTIMLMGDVDRSAEDLGAAGNGYGSWEVVAEVENPAGVVPMVEMHNKAHLGQASSSDLDPILSKQDMVNKLATDLIVNSEFGAFAQRTATGIELQTDDRGRPVPPEQFLGGPSSVLISENDNARFGALPVSDGQSFIRAIEMFVQHIAAQTRTPPHYLTAGLGQWPSADSLRASEEGLVQKCLRKILGYGESWEEAMRIAFLMRGDRERGTRQDLESLWSNPQRVSLAQVTDAAVKMRSSLDVPRRAVWRILGASPQEIVEWEGELEEERRNEPPPEPAPTPPTGPDDTVRGD